MTVRASLRRWHMWLGWLVGVPMLFWTVSGFVMVARPIEEVRGTALLRDPAPLSARRARRSRRRSMACRSTKPDARAARRRAALGHPPSPATRRAAASPIPPPGACCPLSAPPRRSAKSLRATPARRASPAVTRIDPADPPIELRRPLDGWQVRMDDGTHFYVDAGSGEVVARRTRFWRVYDFMWGLHIMDLQGRKETNNPWVVKLLTVRPVYDVAGTGAAARLRPARGRRSNPPKASSTRTRLPD